MIDDEVEVVCPYCGEPSTVAVENGEFSMDCPVCCRPWRVRIRSRRDGTVEVSVEPE